MEKKISVSDIIAFIEKAMKENLNISTVVCEYSDICQYGITVYNNSNDRFHIEYWNTRVNDEVETKFRISVNNLNQVYTEFSEMDVALFRVEILKAQEYSKDKVIELFNKFLEEDDSKLTTINDLDSEDD